MKSLIIFTFIILSFQSFSMVNSYSRESKMIAMESTNMQHADRKKRINKKRKRKCSQWGKRSFAG